MTGDAANMPLPPFVRGGQGGPGEMVAHGTNRG